MDADDERRTLDHIKLCHSIIASLIDIIAALWEHVGDPELKEHPNAERLEKLIETIRRATDPNREN